ncbi:MAG TPA: urease accessory protein UreD [Streptosporangiaceae bacterium]|nr:urease accessory protein UreD [Streptosporangiaceae bacterium]
MKASAELVAERGPDGRLRLPVQRSQAPLILRRTADAVYLVSGAAGPLGSDVLDLRIEVRAGATLRLRTVAAAVALPGRYGQESRLTVTATVGPGARLEYLPEPTVVADGARHRTEIWAALAEDAALVLRDEILLGRHGERGGACRTRLAVDRAARPLLRHELDVSGTDPASLGPAVLAGHRAAGALLTVDPGVANGSFGAGEAADLLAADPWVAVMPLAGPGVLITALAHDTRTLRHRLDDAPGLPVLSGTGGGIA